MKKLLFSLFTLLFFAGTANAQLEAGDIVLTGGLKFFPDVTKEAGSYNVLNGTAGTYEVKNIFRDTEFGVEAGYAIDKNIVVGLQVNTSKQATINDYEDVSDSNAYGHMQGKYKTSDAMRSIGVFGKYYLYLGSNEKFALLGKAGVDFRLGGGKTQTADSYTLDVINSTVVKTEGEKTTDYKSRGFGVGITPGLAFFINDRVIVHTYFGSVGYNRDSFKVNPDADGAEWSDPVNTSSFDFSLMDFNLTDMTFGISIIL